MSMVSYPGKVVVAPDKFKGSLAAAAVASHIEIGLRRSRQDIRVELCPIADGGDGTLEAAVTAGFRRMPVAVEGPTGEVIESAYAERDGTAVVEMAEAAGLRRLPGGAKAPLTASSFGAGQLIAAALDDGCHTVVLGIGGSACTDGGAGLICGLGARVLDGSGASVARGGIGLRQVDMVDLTGLHPKLRDARVVVATDVDNPLLGLAGAAAVYGPQKGATDADVVLLEDCLRRWAAVVTDLSGMDVAAAPGAGAAGGVGFVALALLKAALVPGIELILDLLRFPDRLSGADLVITGEGSLDVQSLQGKAPVGVARASRDAGVPVVAIAGRVSLKPMDLRSAGISAAYSLADLEPELNRSIAEAGPLLEQVASKIAREWLAGGPPPIA